MARAWVRVRVRVGVRVGVGVSVGVGAGVGGEEVMLDGACLHLKEDEATTDLG